MRKKIFCYILCITLCFTISLSTPSTPYYINAADTYSLLTSEELEFYTRQSESINQYKTLLSSFNENNNTRNISEQIYDDNYGGAYIDEEGNLIVLQVNPSSQSVRQTKTITSNNDLTILDCEYSFNELISVITTINDSLEYLLQQNIIITSMYEDVYSNRVIIDVLNLTSEKETLIRSLINSPCMVIQNSSCREQFTSVTDLKGGDEIYNSEDSSTLGFCATKQGTEGFVISGHVGDKFGEVFYSTGRNIGTVTDTAYYNRSCADAAYVTKSSAVNTTNLIGIFKCHYLASELSDFPVGAQVSKFGIKTGITTGQILSNYHTSYTVKDSTSVGYYFIQQATASFEVYDGDSGGPVYMVKDVINGQVTCKLLGIISSRNKTYGHDEYYAVFSKLHLIEYELDIQAITY